MEGNNNKENKDKIKKKFNETGILGLTSEDHKAINSTPPDLLSKDSNKTMGELMSEEEARKYIDSQIESLSDLVFNNPELAGEKSIRENAERFRASLLYLDSIGKLPEKYYKYFNPKWLLE